MPKVKRHTSNTKMVNLIGYVKLGSNRHKFVWDSQRCLEVCSLTNMYQISMNILFEPVIVTALVNTFPPGLFLFLSVLTPYSFDTAGSLESNSGPTNRLNTAAIQRLLSILVYITLQWMGCKVTLNYLRSYMSNCPKIWHFVFFSAIWCVGDLF